MLFVFIVSHQVKLKMPAATAGHADSLFDEDEVGGVQEQRDGVFALYNRARLCSLLDIFEEDVANGMCTCSAEKCSIALCSAFF